MCMRVVLTAVYLDLSQIVAVSHSVRRYVAEKTDMKAIRFITSYLLPPPKKAVLAFLGIPLQSGEKPEPVSEIVRKAEADVSQPSLSCSSALISHVFDTQFVDAVTGHAYNAIVALHGQDWTVESVDKLPEGVQPQISVEELLLCEEIIRADERVVKLAAEVGQYEMQAPPSYPGLADPLIKASNRSNSTLMGGRLASMLASLRLCAFSKLSCSLAGVVTRTFTRIP